MPADGPSEGTVDSSEGSGIGAGAPSSMGPSPSRQVRSRLVSKLARDRSARVALVIVGGIAAAAVAAPLLAPADPTLIVDAPLEGPGWPYLLGTDGLGRDMLSRLLFGTRLTLGFSVLAAAAVTVLGLIVGLCAGYFGGVVDAVLMRLVDVVLAFPGLLAALAIAGLLRPSLTAVLLGLVSVWWAGYSRIIRGLVLAIRERPFVEAAEALGAGHTGVFLRHLLPHVVPAAVVLATLDVGALILAFAGLSFLGLGAQPPTPEWGAMLNEGRTYFLSAPRVMLVPGAALSLLVLAFNILGDGLRDALDPTITVRR